MEFCLCHPAGEILNVSEDFFKKRRYEKVNYSLIVLINLILRVVDDKNFIILSSTYN
jgi:hypothetical protein